MKLELLTKGMLVAALDAYFELAYGSPSDRRKRPDDVLPGDAPPTAILGLFQEEHVQEGGSSARRFAMRLGNRNYPFMKMLLQEHIVPGEFFFCIDTHDDLSIPPSYPDYEAWMATRRFNRELSKRIEERFVELGLPTAATIRRLCDDRRIDPKGDGSGVRVLVVDDEEHLAAAVAAVLRARGYEVETAADGPTGLAAARARPPDLMILDYELPEMDGLEVLEEMSEDDALSRVPVLFSTASRIDPSVIGKADGFLAKPFAEDLLYSMVRRILDEQRVNKSRRSS